METQKILQSLLLKYPGKIPAIYELPAPYCPGGTENVKAIYLGRHSTNSHSDPLLSILNRAIKSHEEQLKQVGLDWEDVYVQNLCKNYFFEGTSAYSELWKEVANEWIENLKEELEIFDPSIPVLMTYEPIYEVLLNSDQQMREPVEFYNCARPIPIPAVHNKLNRPLIAMYIGHGDYRLAKWPNYRDTIKGRIHKKSNPIQKKETVEEKPIQKKKAIGSFKLRAAELQKLFVATKGVAFKEYCILHDEHALQIQLVLWPGIIEAIEKMKKGKLISNDGRVINAFKNMLRSEHIPYNFFMPLCLLENRDEVLKFYKKLLDRNDLKEISSFQIEWTPKPAKLYLKDNTSFDVYIEFITHDNNKLGVGIEVKFTEKSYPFGETERSRLETNDDTSPYYKVWSNAGAEFYKEDTYKKLGTKDLKQFFRNHLLGISMISSSDAKVKIDEFISVHLFPSGNTYQSEKANDYSNTLREDEKQYFKPIAFESFIKEARNVFQDEVSKEWLNYLQARYIV